MKDEKVADLSSDMSDKMSGSEKRKLADQLNKLILDGKITEKDLDNLVFCGFPKDSIQIWKELYKPANKRKEHNFRGASFRRVESGPIVSKETSSIEDVELGSLEKANTNSVNELNDEKVLTTGSLLEGFAKRFNKADSPSKDQFDNAFKTIEMYAKTVQEASLSPEKDLVNEVKNLRDSAEKLGLIKLKNPVFKRVETAQDGSENSKQTKIVYDEIGKVLRDGKDGSVVQIPEPAKQCTDCGSPERDMITPKAAATHEQQKEVQRQVALGKTVQFQNEIQCLTNRIKDPIFNYDDFYTESYGYNKGCFFEMRELFDWAMERKPTATIEIKDLALLLQACEDWHRNSGISKQLEYVEWFKQRIEWLENQRDINARALQGMLSDNDSLLDGLKRNKQVKTTSQAVSELTQGKTLGEVSANNLEEAAKILRKYAENLDKPQEILNPFHQSMKNAQDEFDKAFPPTNVIKKIDPYEFVEPDDKDDFIATPVDVKGTDGPFRRLVKPTWSPDLESSFKEEKQSVGQKIKNHLKIVEERIKNPNISYTEAAKNLFSDKSKICKSEFIPKPMFDLSLWQKTKVYFRDLKNKASTLFKSPQITEEEVDRAIRIMETQIAEIKKSKDPSPEMYAHLFDRLLPENREPEGFCEVQKKNNKLK